MIAIKHLNHKLISKNHFLNENFKHCFSSLETYVIYEIGLLALSFSLPLMNKLNDFTFVDFV